jgi:formylglycine-generating enzyme required for sulfatase activity
MSVLEGDARVWSRGADSARWDEADPWQGEFPWQNLNVDGFEGTSPVGSFPPESPCCAPELLPGDRFPRKVIKGGSHLCAPNYCLRYRPAARQGETIDTSTCHIGFRCLVRSDE